MCLTREREPTKGGIRGRGGRGGGAGCVGERGERGERGEPGCFALIGHDQEIAGDDEGAGNEDWVFHGAEW